MQRRSPGTRVASFERGMPNSSRSRRRRRSLGLMRGICAVIVRHIFELLGALSRMAGFCNRPGASIITVVDLRYTGTGISSVAGRQVVGRDPPPGELPGGAALPAGYMHPASTGAAARTPNAGPATHDEGSLLELDQFPHRDGNPSLNSRMFFKREARGFSAHGSHAAPIARASNPLCHSRAW